MQLNFDTAKKSQKRFPMSKLKSSQLTREELLSLIGVLRSSLYDCLFDDHDTVETHQVLSNTAFDVDEPVANSIDCLFKLKDANDV